VKVALWMIRQYQRWISPMLMPACRFQPTCSEYAAEALVRHGFFMGLMLALWRLLRCNPFAKGGLDLVPPEFRFHSCAGEDAPATAGQSPQRANSGLVGDPDSRPALHAYSVSFPGRHN
jgi:hypothetical protein